MKPDSDRSSPGSAAVVLPQQERSRESLKRFVGAATTLLDSESFSALTINALAGEAGFSVGAFYARFKDKHALLDYLDEEAVAAIQDAATQYCEDEKWKAAPLSDLLRDIVGFVVRFHRERQGVLRAVWLRARSGDSPTEADSVDTRWADVLAVIASRRKEISHPSPEQAVPVGLLMVLSSVRERVLFPESLLSAVPVSDDLLADEVTDAFLGYLLQ